MSGLSAKVTRKASIGIKVKRAGETEFKPLSRWSRVKTWGNDSLNRVKEILRWLMS